MNFSLVMNLMAADDPSKAMGASQNQCLIFVSEGRACNSSCVCASPREIESATVTRSGETSTLAFANGMKIQMRHTDLVQTVNYSLLHFDTDADVMKLLDNKSNAAQGEGGQELARQEIPTAGEVLRVAGRLNRLGLLKDETAKQADSFAMTSSYVCSKVYPLRMFLSPCLSKACVTLKHPQARSVIQNAIRRTYEISQVMNIAPKDYLCSGQGLFESIEKEREVALKKLRQMRSSATGEELNKINERMAAIEESHRFIQTEIRHVGLLYDAPTAAKAVATSPRRQEQVIEKDHVIVKLKQMTRCENEVILNGFRESVGRFLKNKYANFHKYDYAGCRFDVTLDTPQAKMHLPTPELQSFYDDDKAIREFLKPFLTDQTTQTAPKPRLPHKQAMPAADAGNR